MAMLDESGVTTLLSASARAWRSVVLAPCVACLAASNSLASGRVYGLVTQFDTQHFAEVK